MTAPPPSPTSNSREESEESTSRITRGTLLARRYRVLALLGRGGSSAVYRAEDLVHGRIVALKVFDEDVTRNRRTRDRLLEELYLARRAEQPGVVRIYRAVETESHVLLVMHCVDGESLADRLAQTATVELPEALQIARTLCATLATAHERGVIHRDLKPANVLLSKDGRAFLTDFGTARALTSTPPTAHPGAAVAAAPNGGTPAYMAPEQLLDQGTSIQSDLFALGLVLYELFTGRPVFQARSLSELLDEHAHGEFQPPCELRPELPEALGTAIERCLARNPQRRPHSGRELVSLIDGLSSRRSAGPQPAGAPRTGGRLATAGALLLSLAGFASSPIGELPSQGPLGTSSPASPATPTVCLTLESDTTACLPPTIEPLSSPRVAAGEARLVAQRRDRSSGPQVARLVFVPSRQDRVQVETFRRRVHAHLRERQQRASF